MAFLAPPSGRSRSRHRDEEDGRGRERGKSEDGRRVHSTSKSKSNTRDEKRRSKSRDYRHRSRSREHDRRSKSRDHHRSRSKDLDLTKSKRRTRTKRVASSPAVKSKKKTTKDSDSSSEDSSSDESDVEERYCLACKNALEKCRIWDPPIAAALYDSQKYFKSPPVCFMHLRSKDVVRDDELITLEDLWEEMKAKEPCEVCDAARKLAKPLPVPDEGAKREVEKYFSPTPFCYTHRKREDIVDGEELVSVRKFWKRMKRKEICLFCEAAKRLSRPLLEGPNEKAFTEGERWFYPSPLCLKHKDRRRILEWGKVMGMEDYWKMRVQGERMRRDAERKEAWEMHRMEAERKEIWDMERREAERKEAWEIHRMEAKRKEIWDMERKEAERKEARKAEKRGERRYSNSSEERGRLRHNARRGSWSGRAPDLLSPDYAVPYRPHSRESRSRDPVPSEERGRPRDDLRGRRTSVIAPDLLSPHQAVSQHQHSRARPRSTIDPYRNTDDFGSQDRTRRRSFDASPLYESRGQSRSPSPFPPQWTENQQRQYLEGFRMLAQPRHEPQTVNDWAAQYPPAPQPSMPDQHIPPSWPPSTNYDWPTSPTPAAAAPTGYHQPVQPSANPEFIPLHPAMSRSYGEPDHVRGSSTAGSGSSSTHQQIQKEENLSLVEKLGIRSPPPIRNLRPLALDR